MTTTIDQPQQLAEEFYCYPRMATGNSPSGITISKCRPLPSGDFGITEYSWGSLSLWFVDDDEFTADERQIAYMAYVTLGMTGEQEDSP